MQGEISILRNTVKGAVSLLRNLGPLTARDLQAVMIDEGHERSEVQRAIQCGLDVGDIELGSGLKLAAPPKAKDDA